ncbi:hypothetical protein [Desertibaculum subflavum]|uniref:hypothetical protein n=1 Tax=Desertibaculum subflavum TaxID=2268458 RepID=UPI000E673CE3
MHIQDPGQDNDNGDSLHCAALGRLAAASAVGCRCAVAVGARRDRALAIGDGARQRLGRLERYLTRRGSVSAAASRGTGAPAALTSLNAMHGGLHLVYRRPSGDIDWTGTDAGPDRFARG